MKCDEGQYLVVFTDYCKKDSIELMGDESGRRIITVKVGEEDRLDLEDASELCLLIHHLDNYEGRLSVHGVEVECKETSAFSLSVPDDWPNVCVGANLYSEELTEILAFIAEGQAKAWLKLFNFCCRNHPSGGGFFRSEIGSGQERSDDGSAQGVSESGIVWVFGRPDEDERLPRNIVDFWQWCSTNDEAFAGVLFAPCAHRGTDSYLERIKDSTQRADTIFVHGCREDEWSCFQGLEVLDYGSQDPYYEQMFKELESATSKSALAKVAETWAKKYRHGVARDLIRHFKHRLVNMVDPLAIDAASIEAAIRIGDEHEVDRLLTGIREDWCQLPRYEPMSVLDRALRLLFSERGALAPPVLVKERREAFSHFKRTGRVRANDTLISSGWCHQNLDFCRRIAEQLGIEVGGESLATREIEDSWIRRYLGAFEDIVLGEKAPSAEATRSRPADGASLLRRYQEAVSLGRMTPDFVARELPDDEKSKASLGQWLRDLERIFEQGGPGKGRK